MSVKKYGALIFALAPAAAMLTVCVTGTSPSSIDEYR